MVFVGTLISDMINMHGVILCLLVTVIYRWNLPGFVVENQTHKNQKIMARQPSVLYKPHDYYCDGKEVSKRIKTYALVKQEMKKLLEERRISWININEQT